MRYNIAILIPCYNEEKNVKKLHKGLVKSLDNLTSKVKKYSIYFINDNSTDDTKNEVINLTKKYNNVRLINLKNKSGKSMAL